MPLVACLGLYDDVGRFACTRNRLRGIRFPETGLASSDSRTYKLSYHCTSTMIRGIEIDTESASQCNQCCGSSKDVNFAHIQEPTGLAHKRTGELATRNKNIRELPTSSSYYMFFARRNRPREWVNPIVGQRPGCCYSSTVCERVKLLELLWAIGMVCLRRHSNMEVTLPSRD